MEVCLFEFRRYNTHCYFGLLTRLKVFLFAFRSSQLNGLEYGQKYEVRVRPLKGLRAGPASPITFVSLSEGSKLYLLIRNV